MSSILPSHIIVGVYRTLFQMSEKTEFPLYITLMCMDFIISLFSVIVIGIENSIYLFMSEHVH